MNTKSTSPLAFLRGMFSLIASLILFILFFSCLSRVADGQQDAGRQNLEQAVRRSTVACYAAEGIYPPSLDYLVEHYGLQVDLDRYVVHYQVFGENLMPEITVLENEP